MRRSRSPKTKAPPRNTLLTAIASQWCEPVETPKSNYLHPVCVALGCIITRRCAELSISRTKAAAAAKMATSALGKIEHADGWYSVNLAARACQAAGINFARAIVDAMIECSQPPPPPPAAPKKRKKPR